MTKPLRALRNEQLASPNPFVRPLLDDLRHLALVRPTCLKIGKLAKQQLQVTSLSLAFPRAYLSRPLAKPLAALLAL